MHSQAIKILQAAINESYFTLRSQIYGLKYAIALLK